MTVQNEVRHAPAPRARRVAFTGYRPQKMPFGFDEQDERYQFSKQKSKIAFYSIL